MAATIFPIKLPAIASSISSETAVAVTMPLFQIALLALFSHLFLARLTNYPPQSPFTEDSHTISWPWLPLLLYDSWDPWERVVRVPLQHITERNERQNSSFFIPSYLSCSHTRPAHSISFHTTCSYLSCQAHTLNHFSQPISHLFVATPGPHTWSLFTPHVHTFPARPTRSITFHTTCFPFFPGQAHTLKQVESTKQVTSHSGRRDIILLIGAYVRCLSWGYLVDWWLIAVLSACCLPVNSVF